MRYASITGLRYGLHLGVAITYDDVFAAVDGDAWHAYTCQMLLLEDVEAYSMHDRLCRM